MKVLLVEDHAKLATTLARGLRRERMAVDVAFDGQDAIDHLAGTTYDVVVLDRDLPRVHGDEVCKQIAAGPGNSRVLMLTAARSVSDRVDGLRLGADDYLPVAPRLPCRPPWRTANSSSIPAAGSPRGPGNSWRSALKSSRSWNACSWPRDACSPSETCLRECGTR
jgi:CheY-like chemotaxis protein